MTTHTSLADYARGQRVRITAIEWDRIAPSEAKRLQALGFDEGAEVSVAYRGIMGGRDPLAVAMGEMTIALRRTHALAMRVDPVR